MSRLLAALVALIVALPASAADKLPPDLALVPGEAVLFAHVKVADVWKSDAFKQARGMFELAGPKAFAALDEQFVPAPSSLERATLVVLAGENDAGPVYAVVLGFGKPIDPDAVRKANMPKAEEKKAGGKKYLADEATGLAVHFAGDSTLVVTPAGGMPAFLDVAGKAGGPLKEAVEQAAKEQVMFAMNNPQHLPLPPMFLAAAPDHVKPVLLAERVTVTMTFAADLSVTLSATYPNAEDAAEAEQALRATAKSGRKSLEGMRADAEKAVFGADGKGTQKRSLAELPAAASGLSTLAWVNWLDGFLADPPLKTTGRTVSATGTLSGWAAQSIGLAAVYVFPAVQKVREAASQMQSSNNLKQLGIAAHAYHDVHNHFPAAAVTDEKGKKLLSWRVALLPYLEQEELYKQFKLDEPWDSEHNKKLIPLMPKVFADPRVEAKAGETFYKVFVHHNSGFDWEVGTKIAAFTDGLSNTVMFAAGGDPVAWTKPDDFEFDPLDADAKLPDLSKPFGTLLVAMFDGSVKTLDLRTMKDAEKRLRAAISRAGGEVLSLDD